MFVMGKPLNQAFTADQLAAAKADGGNGRATVDTSSDDVAHMSFRAVQEFSNRRQRQQTKIIQHIHKISLKPTRRGGPEPEEFLPAPYQNQPS